MTRNCGRPPQAGPVPGDTVQNDLAKADHVLSSSLGAGSRFRTTPTPALFIAIDYVFSREGVIAIWVQLASLT